MRVVFCDDDSRITAQLTAYISEYFRSIGGIQPEMAAYTSGDELLQQEQRVDLAFLDVEMPGQNGISVGAALSGRFQPQEKAAGGVPAPEPRREQ